MRMHDETSNWFDTSKTTVLHVLVLSMSGILILRSLACSPIATSGLRTPDIVRMNE